MIRLHYYIYTVELLEGMIEDKHFTETPLFPSIFNGYFHFFFNLKKKEEKYV